MDDKQLYLSGFKGDQRPLKGGNRHRINLPLDMLILASVALVLLLILSFSLGVERGKRIASVIPIEKESKLEKVEDIIRDLPVEELGGQKEKVLQITPPPSESVQEAAAEKTTDQIHYKIQVATFYKENTANKAVKSLQEEGYPASIAKKGKFVVVYVGNFDNKAKAKEILQSLKKKYKDCILRRL